MSSTRRRAESRQRGRSSEPSPLVPLLVGVVVVGGAAGAYFATRPSPPAPAPPVVPVPPRPTGDPFAALDSAPAPASTGPQPSSLKSVTEWQVARRWSRGTAWTLAIDRATYAYPRIERFRTVYAATDRFADEQPWTLDARAGLALLRDALTHGRAVESQLRDERAVGYQFESIRELISEWGRYEGELERALGPLTADLPSVAEALAVR
jgi:hypothetical protein